MVLEISYIWNHALGGSCVWLLQCICPAFQSLAEWQSRPCFVCMTTTSCGNATLLSMRSPKSSNINSRDPFLSGVLLPVSTFYPIWAPPSYQMQLLSPAYPWGLSHRIIITVSLAFLRATPFNDGMLGRQLEPCLLFQRFLRLSSPYLLLHLPGIGLT